MIVAVELRLDPEARLTTAVAELVMRGQNHLRKFLSGALPFDPTRPGE